MIFIFCLFNIKRIFQDKNRLKNLVIAGAVSIFISISFILPYIELSKSDVYNFEVYNNSKFLYECASNFQDLLKSHLSDVGKEFSISIVLILGTVLIFFCKDVNYKDNKFLIDTLIIGIIFLVLSTRLIPWKMLKVFEIIQFPFRFSIIFSLLLSYVTGEAIFRYFKEPKIIMCVTLIIVGFVANQLSTANVNMNDSTFDQMINNYPLGLEEYSPIGLDINLNFICDMEDEPSVKKNKDHLLENYIDKDGNVIERENIPTIDYEKNGNRIEFDYDKDKLINLHIPLTYYKGYRAYITDEAGIVHQLNVAKEEKNANIKISSNEILKGHVVVEYKMTPIQIISYCISMISVLGLVSYIVVYYRKQKST